MTKAERERLDRLEYRVNSLLQAIVAAFGAAGVAVPQQLREQRPDLRVVKGAGPG